MIQEIFVVEDKEELINNLIPHFKNNKDISLRHVLSKDVESTLLDIPSLILINEDGLKNHNILELCELIRNNEDNGTTPILVTTSDTSIEHEKDLLKKEIEYCIKKPIDYEVLYLVVKNVINLVAINRGISPLTKLPGNIPIQAELRKRLLKKQDFAVLYFDLDNFKAYNDTYGFLGGDEVIKQTAKIIVKNVNSDEDSHNFIGHIGGDDFVALVSCDNYEDICQKIILEFDKKIVEYFSPEDLEKGYLEVPNRKGIIEEFPLVSISVGIVEVTKGRFHNVLEIGEIGAQVKHLAKVTPGSAYAINRRIPSSDKNN